MNFVHLLTDNIFANYVIEAFDSIEVLDVKHHYFIISSNKNIKYINPGVYNKINFIKNENEFIRQVSVFADFIMIHQLSSPTLSTSPWPLLKLRESVIFIWSTIGCDIYSDVNFLDIKKALTLNLYKHYTRKYFYGIRNFSALISQLLRKIINFCLLKNIAYQKILKRANYISTVLPNEYEFIKQKNMISANFFHFKYISKGFMDAEVKNCKECDMILLGNSASETNNHLDILKILENTNLDTSRLIIPLNYGNKKYANMINSYCIEKQVKADLLFDFMPFNEYIKLLNKCSYCIIGCIRQQAIGNIILMLIRGVKLFLYEDSVIFKYLISRGYYVFKIEDISSNSFNSPLTIEQKRKNFTLITEEYDYAKFIMDLRLFIMSLIESTRSER